MNAAMLLAVRSRLYEGRARALRYITFADLRRKLKPPLEPEHLGAALAMLRLTVDLPAGEAVTDLWTLADRVSTQVLRAGHRGEPFLAHMLSPMVLTTMLRHKPGRMAATALSYTGPTRLERRYGQTEVRGLDAFVSNNHIGPEMAAQVRLLWGELWWDFLYLEQELEKATAEAIVEQILDLLRQAGHHDRSDP
jgi:hypothetical protein